MPVACRLSGLDLNTFSCRSVGEGVVPLTGLEPSALTVRPFDQALVVAVGRSAAPMSSCCMDEPETGKFASTGSSTHCRSCL